MSQQPVLNLPAQSCCHVAAESLGALRTALANGLWKTAAQLAAHGLDDRTLRAIVEEHGEEFVTGNQGYKLMAAATIDELRKGAGRLRSQARKMTQRSITLLNEAHRRLHTPQRETLSPVQQPRSNHEN